MNVMVIEDNKDLAYMLKYILKYELPDCQVATVTDNFVQVINKEWWINTDVAVVDIILPYIDGRAILAWLKAELPRVHRIAWTAMPEEVFRTGHTEPLAHVIIQKPSEPFTIVEAIKSLL